MGAAFFFLEMATAQIGGVATASVLAFRDEAVIERSELRLGDLVDVAILPNAVRDNARSLILARLTRNQRAFISDQKLVSRIRATMPALRPWLPIPTGRSIGIRWHASEPREFSSQSCARSKRIVPAGADLSVFDFDMATCAGKPMAAIRHDPATGISRARRQIAAGELIPDWPGLEGGQIVPGQKLLIGSGFGPVRVEHVVEAVQSAWPGQHLFVRSSDGQLHSIRYEGAR